MTLPEQTDLTVCIARARDGDAAAREALFRRIYDELRRLARSVPGAGRDGETMQPTALVNEAFLELERRFPMPPERIEESRATFYRSVALAMRTIVRDHFRARNAAKRGGGERPIELDEAWAQTSAREQFGAVDMLALDDALDKLEREHPRWHDIVMQRYYAGRTIEQVADVLGVARSTVAADWRLARAWLRKELEGAS